LAAGRPVSTDRLEVGGETSGFVYEPEDSPDTTASSGRGRDGRWEDFLGAKPPNVRGFQADDGDEAPSGLALAMWFALKGLATKTPESPGEPLFVFREKRFTSGGCPAKLRRSY
jgi:hypothetical protein